MVAAVAKIKYKPHDSAPSYFSSTCTCRYGLLYVSVGMGSV